MVLLWGLESDEPMAAVHDALRQLGADILLLDQRRIDEIACEIGEGPELRGFVRCGAHRSQLDAISACYVRPYDTRRVPVVARAGPNSAVWTHAIRLDELLLGWLEITPALVVNRPSAMLSNGSKPYQLTLICQAGFAVPNTLVTTDPASALAFWERHGQVIYKSVSGVRSRVARLSWADRDRLLDVVHCPTQFQEYIAGRDYRAHVIGHQVYGCEVRSRSDDYRYSGATGEPPELWASRLPRDIEERLVAMTRQMNLEVAGVDLRRTPDDNWYCFEVNPSPGFTFYDAVAGQGLAHAIARHLLAGPSAKHAS
jgi:hypothetical protein